MLEATAKVNLFLVKRAPMSDSLTARKFGRGVSKSEERKGEKRN